MILARPAGVARARDRRRNVPIQAYVGYNGDGKTLTAVWDTLPTLEEGRPVLSTARFLDYSNPRPCEGWRNRITGWTQTDDWLYAPVWERVDCDDVAHGRPEHRQAHPLWDRWTSWGQLLDWKCGDVVADEITGIADSSEWASVPTSVLVKLPQLRRHEVSIRITAIDWMNITNRLRQPTLALTKCRSSMPVPKSDAFGKGRIYRPRRLVVQTTYDSKTLPKDSQTETNYENARVLVKSRLWVPDCIARLAYDTYAPVDIVGTVTESGRCAHCGGQRRAPQCDCPDYTSTRPAGSRARRRPGAEDAEAGDPASTGRHVHQDERIHPAPRNNPGTALITTLQAPGARR